MGNKLSRAERLELEEILQNWMTPSQIVRILKDISDKIGSVKFFNQGGLAFLRDAYIAGKFATSTNADAVKLVRDEWPDFHILRTGTETSFEAVEADDPARKRGDEYRSSTGEIEDDPDLGLQKNLESATSYLQIAARKKIQKNYGSKTNLVIYLNFGQYHWYRSEIENIFANSTADARTHFHSIWVLRQDTAYKVWSDESPLAYSALGCPSGQPPS